MQSEVDRRRMRVFTGSTLVSVMSGVPVLSAAEKSDEMEVPAAEDLMREHGILRRALLVYSETASQLSHGNGNVPLDELGRTAALRLTSRVFSSCVL